MPVRTVIKFPDERLKEKSSLVEDFNSEETTNIIKDLKDTLNVQQGLAISAPQVGFTKQIVVLDLEKLANKKYEEGEKYFVLINPTIKEQSNQTSVSKIIRISVLTPKIGNGILSINDLEKDQYAWTKTPTIDLDENQFTLVSDSEIFRPWKIIKKN